LWFELVLCHISGAYWFHSLLLPTGKSPPIHCLCTVHSSCTQSMHDRTLRFTVPHTSLPIHCPFTADFTADFTACPLFVHCLFTAFAAFAAYLLPIHWQCTTYSLPMHCLCTAYALPVHCVFTVYSLCIRVMYHITLWLKFILCCMNSVVSTAMSSTTVFIAVHLFNTVLNTILNRAHLCTYHITLWLKVVLCHINSVVSTVMSCTTVFIAVHLLITVLNTILNTVLITVRTI
jgi:hypothetical protein